MGIHICSSPANDQSAHAFFRVDFLEYGLIILVTSSIILVEEIRKLIPTQCRIKMGWIISEKLNGKLWGSRLNVEK